LVVAEDDDCPTWFCNLQYWGSASAGMTEKHCIYFTRFFSGTRGSTCSGLSTSTVYCFITNNFELPSLTISELYRERWSVELFFKWIKQHLKIKSFYGTSRNAVYSQIWIAICTYLLIAIAKKKMRIEQSLYTFSQTLGLTLFEKMPINEIFNKVDATKTKSDYPMLFSPSDF